MGKHSDSAPTVVLNRNDTDNWRDLVKAVAKSPTSSVTTKNSELTRAESKLDEGKKRDALLNDKAFLKDLLSICKKVFDEHIISLPHKNILPKISATDASTKAFQLRNRVTAGSMGEEIGSELKKIVQHAVIASGQLLGNSERETHNAILEVGELAEKYMARTLSSIGDYTDAQAWQYRVEKKGDATLKLSSFLRKALTAIS